MSELESDWEKRQRSSTCKVFMKRVVTSLFARTFISAILLAGLAIVFTQGETRSPYAILAFPLILLSFPILVTAVLIFDYGSNVGCEMPFIFRLQAFLFLLIVCLLILSLALKIERQEKSFERLIQWLLLTIAWAICGALFFVGTQELLLCPK